MKQANKIMLEQDQNIMSYHVLPSPASVCVSTTNILTHVQDSRTVIQNILNGKDHRLLLIIGPCSIHDTSAAIEYAINLHQWAQDHQDKVFIVMRTYFEKPRTITGWKGLLYDPDMDGSYNIEKGIHTVRDCLLNINKLGLPCACEFLDPNMPQYYSDLISWGAIGARTTESQIHRQMASGLSCPIGFKNSTSGSVKYPIHSIKSCSVSHVFPGIDHAGRACIIRTRGNPYCHVVLRGSEDGPNYDLDSVLEVAKALEDHHLPHNRIVIDCSHGNSAKCHMNQKKVWKEIVDNHLIQQPIPITGLMVESFLKEGNCKMDESKDLENYGCSITDKCISWEHTKEMLDYTYGALQASATTATATHQ